MRCFVLSLTVLSGVLAARAGVFTNDGVRLEFDAKGRVASLSELATGRELVRSPRPFVFVRRHDGRPELPVSFRSDGNRLVYSFADGVSSIGFEVKPFPGGWTLVFVGCDHAAAKEVLACDLAPACTNNLGVYANMFSDARSGVCLRSYDLPLAMAIDRSGRFWVRATPPFDGLRFGLVAGPRGELVRKLRDMTFESGVPVSRCGGAWALGAEANRGSYLQPKLKAAAVDRWIDLAERGGFTTIHLRQWMETLGHYEPKRELCPQGWDDFFRVAEKIRAAGLRVGVHTLTACVSPRDPWTASPMNRDLISRCSYVLARGLDAEADELEVTEPPKTVHDVSLTYFGNGNALRIGGEIVQYTGFTKTPPYRYTGLKRGAFGTRRSSHAAGAAVDYLQQRYLAFYPKPDSPLADALVSRIAWFVNKGRFDQIYFDGSEGMMTRYGIDAMRRRLFEAIGRDIVVEASCQTAHAWWHHSRAGAWDGANFDFKAFYDLHAGHTASVRAADLMEPQMGWWLFRRQQLQYRGQFADDIEYFAARNAGTDSPMSFMEVDVNEGPLSLYRENAVTALGWYERFRLARSFRDEVLAAFREPGKESRLRQDDAGIWRVHPVAFSETEVSECRHAWEVDSPEKRAFELRIEPLYSNKPYDDARALAVFAASTGGVAVSSAEKTSVTVRETDSPHGAALAVKAGNAGAPFRGSWVKLARRHAEDLRPGNRRGFGFWVRGDGSGAVLNVQFRMPRAYGATTADYMFRIDFTGWRYVSSSIRERTPAEAMRWTWEKPIRGYGRYLSEMNMLHLSEVNVYLNGIPPGGSVDLEFTELRMTDTFDAVLANAAFSLDGVEELVPFAVKSGESAERAGGFWRHWNAAGDLVSAVPAKPLSAGAGRARLVFRASPHEGSPVRARICTFAVGEGVAALRDGATAATCSVMAYEAQAAELFDPDRGCRSLSPVRVRPGESAAVEFRFVGPVKGGALTFAGKTCAVPDLPTGGEFVLKIPGAFTGVNPVSFSAVKGGCRIGAVKRYRTSGGAR